MPTAPTARAWRATRKWLRSAARGNPYRIERPRAAVRIGELVSPLRYDVLVRAGHFEFIRAHRDLYATDFETYQRLARAEPYFIWFEHVMLPSWYPHLLSDRDRFEDAWRRRLRKSFALYESFERVGFDRAHPIVLETGARIHPTPTGKQPKRSVFAGDGNHRLALLLASGADVLEPAQYRVKRFRSFTPPDTTGFLLEWTGAEWSDYRDFIALGYPDARLELVDGGVAVSASDPAVAAEVDALVADDLPSLRHRVTVPA